MIKEYSIGFAELYNSFYACGTRAITTQFRFTANANAIFFSVSLTFSCTRYLLEECVCLIGNCTSLGRPFGAFFGAEVVIGTETEGQ